jgi:5-methyltetrahydrofolate--homocysteine methyltransferase
MIIIGEKLNGFVKNTAAAIQNRDEAFLRALALDQANAGADYIDVCAANGETEAATLQWLAALAEEASGVPVCLDSPNPEVIAAVLPHCKREGVVNSVSLESGKIDTLFPLLAHTNWKVVALLCSNAGVPETVSGRLELFEQILDAAKRYEIDESRLLIDPVLHALATDEAAFVTYAECAHEIRKRSDRVHIVSGMSNISFGLPARAQINRAFLVLAMQAGMDSAILNPLDRELMGLLYATRALLGEDEYCMEYIGAYREGKFGGNA